MWKLTESLKKLEKKIFFFQKDFLRDFEIRDNKQKSSHKKNYFLTWTQHNGYMSDLGYSGHLALNYHHSIFITFEKKGRRIARYHTIYTSKREVV